MVNICCKKNPCAGLLKDKWLEKLGLSHQKEHWCLASACLPFRGCKISQQRFSGVSIITPVLALTTAFLSFET